MNIRQLAIDKDILDILVAVLDDEEEEWYVEEDDDIPKPEIEMLPLYTSLKRQSMGFGIPMKSAAHGDYDEQDREIHKRSKENDDAIMVPTPAHNVVHHLSREYYEQLIAQIKEQNKDDHQAPDLEYMIKRSNIQNHLRSHAGCSCDHSYTEGD